VRNIIADFVEWARYQRKLRMYPSREGTRASIGPRRRYKTGTKYDASRLNKERERARRLAAGGDPQSGAAGAIRPKPRAAKTAGIARARGR